MFIGAMGFNISNIAGVLYGDVPLNLSTSQEVGSLLPGLRCFMGSGWGMGGGGGGVGWGSRWVVKGSRVLEWEKAERHVEAPFYKACVAGGSE